MFRVSLNIIDFCNLLSRLTTAHWFIFFLFQCSCLVFLMLLQVYLVQAKESRASLNSGGVSPIFHSSTVKYQYYIYLHSDSISNTYYMLNTHLIHIGVNAAKEVSSPQSQEPIHSYLTSMDCNIYRLQLSELMSHFELPVVTFGFEADHDVHGSGVTESKLLTYPCCTTAHTTQSTWSRHA